jgi:hypothetical protein
VNRLRQTRACGELQGQIEIHDGGLSGTDREASQCTLCNHDGAGVHAARSLAGPSRLVTRSLPPPVGAWRASVARFRWALAVGMHLQPTYLRCLHGYGLCLWRLGRLRRPNASSRGFFRSTRTPTRASGSAGTMFGMGGHGKTARNTRRKLTQPSRRLTRKKPRGYRGWECEEGDSNPHGC